MLPPPPLNVLEIGGATGILERTYRETSHNKITNWYIIDPKPNPIDTNAEYITGYFPDDVPDKLKFDMIVHSHVMEHSYSPRDFVKKLSSIMPLGMKMVFSVPNLGYLLKNKSVSILNFEHTVYLSEQYVDYLLINFGFCIENKFNFNNHSIIYSVQKVQKNQNADKAVIPNLYKENKLLFMNYIDTNRMKMNRLNRLIRDTNRPIFLFGGHISSQFYIAFGLNVGKISGILDNDVFKHGKRLAGTDLIVSSPNSLQKYKEPIVILPDSPYADEIKEKLISDTGCHVEFIEMRKL